MKASNWKNRVYRWFDEVEWYTGKPLESLSWPEVEGCLRLLRAPEFVISIARECSPDYHSRLDAEMSTRLQLRDLHPQRRIL